MQSWLTDLGHSRPLLRQLKGGGACVTEFNSRLRQDLELIGADTTFTYHCIRGQRIREAGENGLARPSIMHGAGHTTGSHATNYPATDKAWTLAGAGYSADPEVMAAHVKALYQEMNGYAEQVVNSLYSAHRPELLALEKAASPGSPLSDWLHMVRHCITSWVVSTCSRPRDRFGYILKDLPTKGEIIADDFYSHMDAVDDTEEYSQLLSIVRAIEDDEIALGDLAHVPVSERHIRKDIATLKMAVEASTTSAAAAAVESSNVVAVTASTISNAIVDAASSGSQVRRCDACSSKPFILQLQHACRRPSEVNPVGWNPSDKLHGCACRQFISSDNSRCREMADVLRFGSNTDEYGRPVDGERVEEKFMRLYNEWDGAIEHEQCVDQMNCTWLLSAVMMDYHEVVDFLLRRGSQPVLETVDLIYGKPIAVAIERANGNMLRLLLECGADANSPCTPSSAYGLGHTPQYLIEWAPSDECRLRLQDVIRPFLHGVPVARSGIPSRGSTSSWLPLTQKMGSAPVMRRPAEIGSGARKDTIVDEQCLSHGNTTETEADLRQKLAMREAELEAYAGHFHLPKVPQSIPLPTSQLQDVAHMLRIWQTIIAPQERKGFSWRSTDKVGEYYAGKIAKMLSRDYYAVLNEVMREHLDNEKSIDDAVSEIDRRRIEKGDWTKYTQGLPTVKREDKTRFKSALLAMRMGSDSVREAHSSPQNMVRQPAVDLQIQDQSTDTGSMSSCSVQPVDGGVVRYIGLDPASSCGFAVLQLNMSGQIISIDVGVFDLDKSSQNRGAQCNDLKRQLLPLLTPSPDFVMIEDYHVHSDKRGHVSQIGVDLNYKLRGAIEMTLDDQKIEYGFVNQNDWKKCVTRRGNSDKKEVRETIELKMGVHFPEFIFASGKWTRSQKKREDASDVCILQISLYCARVSSPL